MLLKTVEAVRKVRPDLPLVKVADGARDNWKFLDSDAFPYSLQVADFYHAIQHLSDAIASVFSVHTDETNSKYEEFCSTLRYHKYGFGKVVSFFA